MPTELRARLPRLRPVEKSCRVHLLLPPSLDQACKQEVAKEGIGFLAFIRRSIKNKILVDLERVQAAQEGKIFIPTLLGQEIDVDALMSLYPL